MERFGANNSIKSHFELVKILQSSNNFETVWKNFKCANLKISAEIGIYIFELNDLINRALKKGDLAENREVGHGDGWITVRHGSATADLWL